MYRYHFTDNDGRATLSIVFSAEAPVTVTNDQPGFAELVEAVRAKAPVEEIRRLADRARPLHDIVKLSNRMELRDGKLYFDDERVRGRIARHLRRMAAQQDPQLISLVLFLTNLKANPSAASQDALYRWLSDRDFTITRAGNIIAYKGLTATGTSLMSGHAWVNGVRVEGQIPNPVEAVVTMPRDEVDPNRFQTCSFGLHVGTYAYAKDWSQGMVARVEVDPRDVVMVPDDCGAAKMRVCRYKVLGTTVEEYKLPVAHDPDAPHDQPSRDS